MSTTTIEWTQTVWNPTVGCDRVTPGCDHCYAIGHAHRFVRDNTGPLATERRDGRTDWTGRVALHPERLNAPLRWRKPRRIFVNSMSDLFHSEVPGEFVARVFAVMAATPQHTYQVLTKRHSRMRFLLGNDGQTLLEYTEDEADARALYDAGWPLPNVWVGVSVEDQKRADLRIPALLDTPAAVRFISAEPLLGPVDLSRWLWLTGATTAGPFYDHAGRRRGGGGIGGMAITSVPANDLHWIIAGGESGPKARPMHPEWARSLRDQCQHAGIPFFFKQWGEWAPTGAIGMGGDSRSMFVGPQIDEPGFREEIERMGKKAAGRELDGRTWDEYPEVHA